MIRKKSYDIESELDYKIQAAMYEVEHASDDVTLEWPVEVDSWTKLSKSLL
ncbi:hypothetical protein SAMN02910369_02901 [Lachnospiraceae bacterium NE2001]|nr:hypothetical protein SAMN02910369_02901 [Lachnospiraceae bacterium NE2001]